MQVPKKKDGIMTPRYLVVAVWGLMIAAPLLRADVAWTQWGGPNGDFSCDAVALAEKWGDGGPAEIWSREIGPGHSTILYEDGVLYTMCRREMQDAILAVNAVTGKTIWEHRYDAPPEPGMLLDYGMGPHSSPLLVGDRLFTIGGTVHFNCLDKKTGTVLWSRHLSKELGVSNMLRGYGSSPIAYKDFVLVNVGAGRGATDPSGIAAFRQNNGEIAWKSEPLSPGYPTPVLVDFNGRDMLIDCLGFSRFGLDPATGKMLWKTQIDRQSASIITSPLWIPPDKVLFSAGHGGGTRLYQLSTAEDGTIKAEELWYFNKLRIMHANAVRIDDHVYGSSGDLGPAYLMAVDLNDGKLKWRARGFSKATLLLVGKKLVILDEDGNLGVATPTPEQLTVHAKTKVLERYAWTAPTLIGTRLYLRDDHTFKCVDLGVSANKSSMEVN